MKKTKVVTKLIAIILSILVVVQVVPMTTFAETIEEEREKQEISGYSTQVSQEEEEPTVIGEDIERRDSSNVKYFKMSDGTIKAAVYKDPVLYQDSTGKWQEIDNTLAASSAENDETSNFDGYDSKGNPTALTVKGSETVYIQTGASYTSNGAFVSSTTDQDGLTESYVYDDSKGTLTSYTDKKGNVTNYAYDANTDAVTSVSQTLSNGQTVQNNYTYNKYRLNTISHNGFNYSFVYDNFGNVTQTKVGSQVLCTNTYAANNSGELKRVTYGNGDYVDYAYDEYGNTTSISQNGTQNFTWKYDSTGNLYSHEDLVNNQRFLYTYDSIGRLVRRNVINSSKKTVYASEYGYDLNNNVSKFTSSAGGVTTTEKFDYGKDNLASKYTYPSGVTVTYTYDSILRRNKAVINTTTPIDHQYVYRLSDRGDNARTTKIGWEHIGEYIYGYTYDANGNITEISRRHKTAETVYTKQQQFAYDELNQLVRADDLVKNCTEVYTYDNGGNILSVTTYPLTWGSLDGVTATKTVNYGYDDTNWKDKLTSYDGQAITYDEIGNPLSYKGYALTWQNGRQLATLSGNGTTASYTYDVGGLRTSKTVNGVKHEYYYIGSNLQYEKFGTTELWFFYDSDGNPSGVRYKNSSITTDYYFVCNWRGDVIRIYDGTGAVVANYNYDAWGNVISVTDANGAVVTDPTHIANVNPLRYRGYYYDSETGLYYVSSRYYDPEIGRWINADTQLNTVAGVLGYSLFVYCNNNPVKLADPDGHLPFIAITAAIGAVAGAAIGGVIAAKSGKNVWKGALKGAAIGGLIGLGAGAAAGTLLAGSATATVASVVVGSKAVLSVVGSAGITAGAKMLADNASQACSSAPQVFWSGGDIAKNAAKQVANDVGGKTLEMTRLGTYLEQIDATYSVWQAASSNFANVASNSGCAIYSIQNAAGVSLQSTWSTIEYPLLQGRDIIYGIASQGGSIQIML